MIFLIFLFSSLLINAISGQVCNSTLSTGPQVNGTCSSPQIADTTGLCCLTSGLISTTTSTTCVDLLNPVTGVSDCPARASLCNNTVYYSLMTTQCPRTCGRCNSTSTSTSTSCVDRTNPQTGVSDCSARASLCNNSVYYSLMTVQCPRTCGRCNGTNTTTTTTTTTNTTCVDLTNPSTGVSDCSSRVAYCTNSAYITLMRTQCPRTCGFCTSSSSTSTNTTSVTSTSTCADLINPNTGTSDCPGAAYLCSNSAYSTLMRAQCPLTCGVCSG